MTNQFLISLENAPELDYLHLGNEDLLGFHISLFEEMPFVNRSGTQNEKPKLLTDNVLYSQHPMDTSIGNGLLLEFWLIDAPIVNQQFDNRYLIGRLTRASGDPLELTPVLAHFFGLEYTKEVSFSNRIEGAESEKSESNHSIVFKEEATTIWLSSDALNTDELLKITNGHLPNEMPKTLKRGYQWEQEVDLSIGLGLGDWFANTLNGCKVNTVYTKELRNPVIEFELQLKEEQKSANKQNGLDFKVETISVFFLHQEGGSKFDGFGFGGSLNIHFNENALSDTHLFSFNGRLRLDSHTLDLSLTDFPSANRLLEIFGKPKEDDFLVELANNDAGIRIKLIHAAVDLKTFQITQVRLDIDTEKSIHIANRVDFYPELCLTCEYPLISDQRKFDLNVGGFAELYGANFSVSYHKNDKLFFIRMLRGRLKVDDVLNAFKFPTIRGVSIEVIDLEFSAQQDNNIWTYEGHITIGGNISFEIGGLTVYLRNLHAEFKYANKLEHFLVSCQLEMGELLLDSSMQYNEGVGFQLTTGIARPLPLHEFSNFVGLKKDNDQQDKTITEVFGGDLEVRRLMLSVLIPEEEKKPELEFTLAIDTSDEKREWPFPLDHLFFNFRWSDVVEWEAMAHFNFYHHFNHLNQVTAISGLLLSSTKVRDEIAFEGVIEKLDIHQLLLFIEDRFAVSFQNELPSFVKNSVVNLLSVKLVKEKNDWQFNFKCDVTIPLDKNGLKKELAAHLIFEIARKEDESNTLNWNVNLNLEILSDDIGFDFVFTFHHQKAINHLLVDLTLTKTDLKISELLTDFLPSDVEIPLPEIGLKEVFFAVHSDATDKEKIKRNLLFGAVLDAEIDLTQAGFLTKIIPGEVIVGIEDFRLVYALKEWTNKEIKSLTEFHGAKKHNLVLPKTESTEAKSDTGLAKGFAISGTLKVGDLSHDFVVNPSNTVADSNEKSADDETNKEEVIAPKSFFKKEASTEGSGAEESGTLTKWFKINKKLGPIHIQRFGIQFQFKTMEIAMLLDAGLEIAVISASVVGLGVSSPINSFKPHVQLAGLGIDFKREPLEIGGAIISRSNEHLDLAGMLTLGFKDLNMSILGAYKSDGKHSPSLLLYGNLNYPIGGPPFFFVEGLAAGVGIHRKVNLPTVDKIADFPLVSMVMKPSELQGAESLNKGIAQLEANIPVQQDQFFFAAGIKFSTFKVINSFVLVMLSLGKHTELDLLGYSELILPKKVGKADPIAQARLLVRAAFVPQMGTLEVEARLDSAHSYLLSKACKLQGGFAFYTWFKGKELPKNGAKPGDFVLTLGGYHPHFTVPSHYPQVPRLGFQWEVDKHMHFKGELYFALTPSHIMAGGLLEGTWALDHLSASFRLGFNVLIAWQPFHYEVEAFLNIKAGYHDGLLQFDGELNANIQIWGPDFGGTANLEILFIKLKATFGAPKETQKQELNWNQFSDRMLPGNNYFNGRISEGKLPSKKSNAVNLGMVSANGFTLDFDCTVPFVSHEINTDVATEKGKEYGIPAMNQNKVSSHLKINITRNGEPVHNFDIQTKLDSGPAALWGENKPPALNGTTLVENLLFGFTLSPKQANYQLIGAGLVLDHEQDIIEEEVHFFTENKSSNPFVFASVKPEHPALTTEMKEIINLWN